VKIQRNACRKKARKKAALPLIVPETIHFFATWQYYTDQASFSSNRIRQKRLCFFRSSLGVSGVTGIADQIRKRLMPVATLILSRK
jgi:hypothetical protein